VQKSQHTKPILFKAVLLVVFGAFFFVQGQASFIFHAYDNDFQPVSGCHVTIGKSMDMHAGSLTNSARHHFKLNKRYQPVAPHAVLPAAIILQVHVTAVRTNWLIPPVLASTHFLYIKPFRGPPCV